MAEPMEPQDAAAGKAAEDASSDSKPQPQHTTPTSSSNTSLDNNANDDTKPAPSARFGAFRRLYDAVTYVPVRCRWDPDDPPKFSIWLNILFGFAGAFTVANLYYSHAILNILADDFGVEYEQISQVPTLAQAGYAVGLLLLCPLGDLLKRRPFVLDLVFFTATVSYVGCKNVDQIVPECGS